MLMLTIFETITEANRQITWMNLQCEDQSWINAIKSGESANKTWFRTFVYDSEELYCQLVWTLRQVRCSLQLFSCLSCYLYSSGHAVFIKSWVNPVTMSLYTGSQWFEFCEYGVRMLKQYLAFVFFGFELLFALLSPRCKWYVCWFW